MRESNFSVPNERKAKRWRWYHGALLFAGVNLGGGIISSLVKSSRGNKHISTREALTSSEDNKNYYLQLKQPIFSPPSFVFGPVWALNNALVVWGILQVLNKPVGTPGRERYLALQAASFADFTLFNAAFFGLRSPINAAVMTAVYLALTVESGRFSLTDLKDEKVAISLGTLLSWLLLAVPTSAAIAIWNRDGFYKTEAFIEPTSRWVKPVNT